MNLHSVSKLYSTVSWSTGPSVFLLLIIYVVENHCIHYSDCMVSTICCYCSTITLEQFIVAAIMKRLQLVQPFVHRWHEVNGHLDMHYLADTEGFHVCVVSRTLWLTDIRTNTHSLTGIYIWSSIVGYPVLYFCNHKIDIACSIELWSPKAFGRKNTGRLAALHSKSAKIKIVDG